MGLLQYNQSKIALRKLCKYLELTELMDYVLSTPHPDANINEAGSEKYSVTMKDCSFLQACSNRASDCSSNHHAHRCCSQFFDECKPSPWCQKTEEKTEPQVIAFLFNLPKQCIPRIGRCTDDENGCCYPSTYVTANGSKQYMYTPWNIKGCVC
mmetsp:Transcript_18493/g.27750  ORF Transcript_18493/g.27750 Transcript_18493/m.27750 type:complete len:154 (-) Transcript_18493:95-556(-)